MKKVTLILSLCFSVCLFSQQWEKDYKEAVSKAKQVDKPLVLVFSGSDWCGPCKKMDRDVWQSEKFRAYASENYVLYNADFPRKKKNALPSKIVGRNKKLASIYNPKGHFPLVVVMNQEENVLGTTGYEKMAPEAYISLLNSFLE